MYYVNLSPGSAGSDWQPQRHQAGPVEEKGSWEGDKGKIVVYSILLIYQRYGLATLVELIILILQQLTSLFYSFIFFRKDQENEKNEEIEEEQRGRKGSRQQKGAGRNGGGRKG